MLRTELCGGTGNFASDWLHGHWDRIDERIDDRDGLTVVPEWRDQQLGIRRNGQHERLPTIECTP